MDIQEEHSQEMIPKFQNPSNRDKSVEIDVAHVYLRKRYLVSLLVLLDWIIISLMKMNLSISIVDMTSNRTLTIGNETFVREAEFHWSPQEKGILLSAFPLGLMTSPLGALATNKFGSFLTFGASTVIIECLTLLTPPILSWSTTVYLVVRVVEGVCQGIAYSSVAEVLREWSIPSERNRIFSAVPAGFMLASVLGFPVCGTILHLLDWRAVFYITGGISVVWSIIWFSLVSTPQKDKFMSAKERRFILAANKFTSTQKVVYPWKEIFKSKAVWAYWNIRFVEAWSTIFLTYSFPLYIKDSYDGNIQDIGLISGIPNFCAIFGLVGASILADFLVQHKILTVSKVHRLFLNFNHTIAMILLVPAALWMNFTANIIIFSLFRLCYNFASISYMVLPVEMAGQYSPVIMGFAESSFAFGFFLSPMVMGLVVSNNSPSEWSIYFGILSALNLWGAIIFYMFGSGHLQTWAMTQHKTAYDDSKDEEKTQLDVN